MTTNHPLKCSRCKQILTGYDDWLASGTFKELQKNILCDGCAKEQSKSIKPRGGKK